MSLISHPAQTESGTRIKTLNLTPWEVAKNIARNQTQKMTMEDLLKSEQDSSRKTRTEIITMQSIEKTTSQVSPTVRPISFSPIFLSSPTVEYTFGQTEAERGRFRKMAFCS